MSDNFLDKINFPYSFLRDGQELFLRKVYSNLSSCKNIMVSAPTGLGKTVSGLAPAITIAKSENLTVICLTSRQTQANQVIKTIKDISEKSKQKISYVAFIGKRSMCSHPDKDLYPVQDFNDFCKRMKQTGKCKFYKNYQNKDFEEKINSLIDQSSKSFMNVENFVNFVSSPIQIGSDFITGFCPYEMAGKKAFKADVIVCDYNYMFSKGIRESFLGKIGRSLDECILVVDEAHNLPDRIRNSNSYTLNSELIKNASKEIHDFIKTDIYDKYIINLRLTLNDIYHDKLLGDKKEYLISKDEFINIYMSKFDDENYKINDETKKITFKSIINKLKELEAIVKEERIISFLGRVANFLDYWNNLDEENYLRLLEKQIKFDDTNLFLKIKCIDPSQISSKIINNSYSSLLMSATLSPISMYKDILGISNCETLELDSPFSQKMQLTLVVDNVTTKYSLRDNRMYKKIADNLEKILIAMEAKNGIIFFPSYDLMNKIITHIDLLKLNRKILREKRYMSKQEKEKFIDEFKSAYSIKSKVLFAVTSGSFSEGLDLPNEALELVVIVGLPLSMPDLYTNAVIKHFDKKFRKGQLYGYIYPAMSKIIQAAGRCIRTEKDRGVIVLMDNRFFWPLYAQTYPKSWKLIKSRNINIEIKNFYNQN